MYSQLKDHFYDQFLKEPTKDHFVEFMKSSCGELDDMDFKESWIEKGSLAKIMLAMGNYGGGIVVFGVRENDDNTYNLTGLDEFKDGADVNNMIASLVPPDLDYRLLSFNYDSEVYGEIKGKKFQIIVINDTPDRLPFVSLGDSESCNKDNIYIRRGTKSEKATARDIESILERKIATMYSNSNELSLEEHLCQLKILYNELPKEIKVLVKKGELNPASAALAELANKMSILVGTRDQYEYQKNPFYPDETYEQFISRMIKHKKYRIEKVLDLK